MKNTEATSDWPEVKSELEPAEVVSRDARASELLCLWLFLVRPEKDGFSASMCFFLGLCLAALSSNPNLAFTL